MGRLREARLLLEDTLKKVFETHGLSFIDPRLIFVKGGTFSMGADTLMDKEFDADELPQHTVELKDFYVAKYEVTNMEYVVFLNENLHMGKDSIEAMWKDIIEVDKTGNKWIGYIEKKGEYYSVVPGFEAWPVNNVSWHGAQAFCEWFQYNLPTEAQWEYAARGGIEGVKKGYIFAGSNEPVEVAWYNGNAGNELHPIGKKNPNPLMLYDMSGNLWEWCMNTYNARQYSESKKLRQYDPVRLSVNHIFVTRGGGWAAPEREIRITERYPMTHTNYTSVGFRFVSQKRDQ